MTPARIHAALLALALLGAALCLRTSAGAAIAVAAVAALVAFEAFRARAEWAAIDKLSKETAAALIKLETRTSVLERGFKAVVDS